LEVCLYLAVLGCSSSSGGQAPSDAGAGGDGDTGADAPATDYGGRSEAGAAEAGTATNVRGERYCEVLAAELTGSMIHVDVYSTFGLNACPEAQWSTLDSATLAKQLGVTEALLNGPRYWMMDTLTGTLINPTTVTIGGIAMREAGAIDLEAGPSATLGAAYVTHQIQRSTVVTFAAGKPVFELTDPQGKIYDMQSYSIQKVPSQTQATLASLGSVLKPPAGWSFRTRVLTSDLVLTTPGGTATVVQDDNDNTYQQSQQ